MNTNNYNMTPNAPQSGSSEMNLRMHQALQETARLAKETAPQSTRKSYDRLIAEFKAWCEVTFAADDPTRYLVYGSKLNLFMKEMVRFILIQIRMIVSLMYLLFLSKSGCFSQN